LRVEVCNDLLGRNVFEVELHHEALAPVGEKSQEERERVAIAADRVRAHPTHRGQVVGEERAQCAGKRGRPGLHRRVLRGLKTARQWRSNLSLATTTTGSRRAR
jgi:hypothetical protein